MRKSGNQGEEQVSSLSYQVHARELRANLHGDEVGNKAYIQVKKKKMFNQYLRMSEKLEALG